jgi:hypothetical protein
MRIRASMLDGTIHETDTSLYQCLADRLAFKQEFGQSYLAIQKRFFYGGAMRDEMWPEWDERWPAFFDWRCLMRSGGLDVDFATFVEAVAEIDHPDVEVPDESDGDVETPPPDPTETPGETTSTETTSSLPTLRAISG